MLNNRASQSGAGSIGRCLKPRKTVTAAVEAQGLIPKWVWWMCTIRCENESPCEGGPTTLDLTKWDFNKADCRNKCRNLVENSKPLLLIGSPIDSGREDKEQVRAVLHLAFICELYETQIHGGRYFTHIHTPKTVGDKDSQQLWTS